jgi:hypothetical protein
MKTNSFKFNSFKTWFDKCGWFVVLPDGATVGPDTTELECDTRTALFFKELMRLPQVSFSIETISLTSAFNRKVNGSTHLTGIFRFGSTYWIVHPRLTYANFGNWSVGFSHLPLSVSL